MSIITIETDNNQFTKVIVQLCKALGIAKVAVVKETTPPKKLRKDLAERVDAVQNGTATLHSFESIDTLKNQLFVETNIKL
jgi:hypothetical protein